MPGTIACQHGGILRIGGIAEVHQGLDHRQLIILDLAVLCFAERLQPTRAAEAEPCERLSGNNAVGLGNGRNRDQKLVQSFVQLLRGEDLFAVVVPIAVVVEVNPGVEISAATGSRYVEANLHCPHQQRRVEHNAVVECVAAGRCIQQGIGLMADPFSELITLDDHMPCPVAVQYRGKGGIGCVAEVQACQRNIEHDRAVRLIRRQRVVGHIPNRIDLVAVGRGIVQQDRIEAAG